MAKNERIPRHIRKEINKIGPGKYCDPATGRIYIDSADMDDTWEETLDGVRAADEERERRRKAEAAMPKPPDSVREQADAHLLRIAQRFEDSAWVGRAKSRREHLLGRQRWKRSIGSDLEPEDLEELAELEAALHTEDLMDEAESRPDAGMNELVDGLWATIKDLEAKDSDKLEACAELGGLILEVPDLPLPTGYAYDAAMLKKQVFAIGDAMAKKVGDEIFEPLLRGEQEPEVDDTPANVTPAGDDAEPDEDPVAHAEAEQDAADAASEEGEPEKRMVPGIPTKLKGGPAPFDGMMVPVPADLKVFFLVHDPEAGEVTMGAKPIEEGGHTNYRYHVRLEGRNEVGQVAIFVRDENPAGSTEDTGPGAPLSESDDPPDRPNDERDEAAADDGRSLEI